jgi:hypothetical protein
MYIICMCSFVDALGWVFCIGIELKDLYIGGYSM